MFFSEWLLPLDQPVVAVLYVDGRGDGIHIALDADRVYVGPLLMAQPWLVRIHGRGRAAGYLEESKSQWKQVSVHEVRSRHIWSKTLVLSIYLTIIVQGWK